MKILVVDDDFFVRTSLKTIIEAEDNGDFCFQVCALGCDGHEGVSLYGIHLPDVLLMDIRMPNCTGLEAAKTILNKFPQARILLLTTFADDDYIIKALRLGVRGYILKQHFDAIVPALKAVYSDQRVFGDAIAIKLPSLLASSISAPDFSAYDLTEREREVLTAIANGLSNKEIAETLFLSEGTVRNYISTLLEKLALRDRTQLAIFYYKH